MSEQQIKIFDTTLRDGQQCPGAGMSFQQNIEYAQLIAKLGVDVLEAGFPSASQADFDIMVEIIDNIINLDSCPVISALCQLREAQVEKTIAALAGAKAKNKARLHTYVPVDPELMQSSLGHYADDKQKIIKDLEHLVKLACDAGMEVEFSPEGYSRMGVNFDFTSDLIRAAVSAGATIINCPDTIGGACRRNAKDYFVNKMTQHAEIIKTEFPEKQITWSAHCHNDFGLALDNSMCAVFDGPATQVEGCFNGIGERAGNVALEQCIMYIKHFGKDYVDPKTKAKTTYFTNINTEHLQEVSNFINQHMLPRQPHWPVTGDNAARHTSGGHTNAILNNPLAYQPFDPKEVGNKISFIFGPLSGSNHAQSIIQERGYVCDDAEKTTVAQFIKDVYSERRKGITDEELMEAYLFYRQPIKVENFSYSKSADVCTLTIEGEFFDHDSGVEIDYRGDDSALAAFNKAILQNMDDFTIENYSSKSITKGIKSQSEAEIVIKCKDGSIYTGIGQDSDIEISALKALMNAVNQAYIEQNYKA